MFVSTGSRTETGVSYDDSENELVRLLGPAMECQPLGCLSLHSALGMASPTASRRGLKRRNWRLELLSVISTSDKDILRAATLWSLNSA